MVKYFRGKAKKSKGGFKPKSKASAPLQKAITTVVKKQLSAAIQDKMVSRSNLTTAGVNGTQFTAAIPLATDFVPLLPEITQGMNVNQRVADKITVKSCYIDLVMAVNTQFTASVDIQPRVFIVSDKSVTNVSNQANIAVGALIDPGAAPQKYDGTVPNASMYPLNTNQFTKHHDFSLSLTKSVGNGTNITTAGIVAADQVKTYRRYRLKIPLPKVLRYTNQSDVYPSNAAPWLAIGYTSFTNNNEWQYTGGSPLCVNYCVTLRYEDA